MLLLGEVKTGLLQSSTALPTEVLASLLRLLPGEPVLTSDRPISFAASPELLSGVDCRLSSFSGSKVEAIGTVASRGLVVGGHIVQGSADVTVVERQDPQRRLPWSHYLAQPGCLVLTSKAKDEDLASGHLASVARSSGVLALDAISEQVADRVQQTLSLDHRPPIRTQRTSLRWAATGSGADVEPSFHALLRIESDQLRTLSIQCSGVHRDAILTFCHNVALHDWLLSTLLYLIGRSGIGQLGAGEVVRRIRPAFENLLHLWMPLARLDEVTAATWEGLERDPGFSRQWNNAVARLRDLVMVTAVTLLSDDAVSTSGDK